MPEQVFIKLFPNGADVAFASDFDIEDVELWNTVYSKQVDKKSICGIHGILHVTGSPVKKEYFPNRREADVRRFRPVYDDEE